MDLESYKLGYIAGLNDLQKELANRKTANTQQYLRNSRGGYDSLAEVFDQRLREIVVIESIAEALKSKKSTMELFEDK